MGQLHQVLDPVLDGGDSTVAIAKLAFQCVATDKDNWSNTREVVEELKWVWNRTIMMAKERKC